MNRERGGVAGASRITAADGRPLQCKESPARQVGEFVAFLLVGSIGFVIEAGILHLLVVWNRWDVIAARAVSFPTAVLVTWVLNRSFTFRSSRSFRARVEYVRYLAVQIGGALINLCVYVGVIKLAPELEAWPVVPLAIGAGAGLAFNFVASKHFVFYRNRNRRP